MARHGVPGPRWLRRPCGRTSVAVSNSQPCSVPRRVYSSKVLSGAKQTARDAASAIHFRWRGLKVQNDSPADTGPLSLLTF